MTSDDVFPEELTGHFWAQLTLDPETDRWRYEIIDYQNNVMAAGVAVTPAQAAHLVRAWDDVICDAFEGNGDPSLP